MSEGDASKKSSRQKNAPSIVARVGQKCGCGFRGFAPHLLPRRTGASLNLPRIHTHVDTCTTRQDGLARLLIVSVIRSMVLPSIDSSSCKKAQDRGFRKTLYGNRGDVVCGWHTRMGKRKTMIVDVRIMHYSDSDYYAMQPSLARRVAFACLHAHLETRSR